MSPHSIGNHEIKDERWAIKTFRPLLQLLDVQNIPPAPHPRIVPVNKREWIIQRMGRCVIVIEQDVLPAQTGGMLITSHDMELDYFILHILINTNLCDKNNQNTRIEQKLAAVHEFTHTVAALSAIARVKSRELIKRLKAKMYKNAHSLHLSDLTKLVAEISELPSENSYAQKAASKKQFPDEHFRLGFEDFPVSYPVIFEEFLFSKEMLKEYTTDDILNELCKSFKDRDSSAIIRIGNPIIDRIVNEKALDLMFAWKRLIQILYSILINNDT